MGKRQVQEAREQPGGRARPARPIRGARQGPSLDLTRIPPGWAAGTLLVLAALALAVWILSMPAGETETPPTAAPASTSPATAAVPSPEPPRVQVGGWVRVQGTEGGDLRLRAAPGLGGETLALAKEGTVLRVLEGPVEADGYTWWRVQSAEGQAGWAAGQWLVPQ